MLAVLQANVALDAAVQAAHTAGTSADAAIYARLGLAVEATAAVLATLAAGFTASAVVQRTVGVAFSCDAVVMRPVGARPVLDLAGVARPMTALAGSLASTVPCAAFGRLTFLIGKTARKP